MAQNIGFIPTCTGCARPGNERIVDTPEDKRRLKITTLPYARSGQGDSAAIARVKSQIVCL